MSELDLLLRSAAALVAEIQQLPEAELFVSCGGGTDIADVNDTWTWDRTNLTWTPLSPAASPPVRELHKIAKVDGDPLLSRDALEQRIGRVHRMAAA